MNIHMKHGLTLSVRVDAVPRSLSGFGTLVLKLCGVMSSDNSLQSSSAGTNKLMLDHLLSAWFDYTCKLVATKLWQRACKHSHEWWIVTTGRLPDCNKYEAVFRPVWLQTRVLWPSQTPCFPYFFKLYKVVLSLVSSELLTKYRLADKDPDISLFWLGLNTWKDILHPSVTVCTPQQRYHLYVKDSVVSRVLNPCVDSSIVCILILFEWDVRHSQSFSIVWFN